MAFGTRTPSYTSPAYSPPPAPDLKSIGSFGGGTEMDLSFLNDPNNPVWQQFFSTLVPQAASSGGGGGGGGGPTYDSSPGPATVDMSAPSDVGTVIPPVKILEQSPEWLAYINALGLQKSQFAADIARQREIAGANAGFARAGVEPQFDKQRRGITAGAESRGMARSGQLQKDLAVSRGEQKRAYSGIYQNLQNTVSDLESNLAQKNLELDVGREQQKASMISAGYKSNGLYDYLNSLPKA